MNNRNLASWLERLESLHPSEIDLGLERVAAVASTLELLPVSVPVISVAGTNGKGSTVAVLEAVLGETGQLVGVCCSPHLLRFNERIRVGGEEASDEEIVRAFGFIDNARGETSLTYFEFATLAALLVFKWRAVSVVVLEVGLGGRLDAVNIADASVAIITSIALDHQAWLGDTREAIAREKAGIVRRDRPVVIAEPAPPENLEPLCREAGAQVVQLGREFFCDPLGDHWQGRLWQPDGGCRTLPPMPRGALVNTNIAAALQALLLLEINFSDAQLHRALSQLQPAGRRQLCELAQRQYLLDVAHNPAAVQKLHEFISLSPCKGKTIALFSAMADKDIRGMIHAVGEGFQAWFLADQPAVPRAARADDIAAILRQQGQYMISVSKNLRQALRRAQAVMAPGDRLVVFGSFYTVAAILPLLEKDRRKG